MVGQRGRCRSRGVDVRGHSRRIVEPAGLSESGVSAAGRDHRPARRIPDGGDPRHRIAPGKHPGAHRHSESVDVEEVHELVGMTMSNDLTKKQSGTGLSTESGRFRQDLINQLTPEQRKELALKAGQEQLDLDKSDADAVRRFNATSVEMQRDVQTAKDLNAIGSDFTMENSYKTCC